MGSNPDLAHCNRCGRHNHLAHECYADAHIDGTRLKERKDVCIRKKARGSNDGGFTRYYKLQSKRDDKHKIKSSHQLNQLRKQIMLLGQVVQGSDANPAIQSCHTAVSNILKELDPRNT